MSENRYNIDTFAREGRDFLDAVRDCRDLSAARPKLTATVMSYLNRRSAPQMHLPAHELIRTRDCAAALLSIFTERSDSLTGFSVGQAFLDIAQGRQRDDLCEAFFAELINWIGGLKGTARFIYIPAKEYDSSLSGRAAAIARSDSLDQISDYMEQKISSFADGLAPEAVERRKARKQHILNVFGANEKDWNNWQWHTDHIIKDAKLLGRIVELSDAELSLIEKWNRLNLPFGITPWYASLIDCRNEGRDGAIRAQVIPPSQYAELIDTDDKKTPYGCDFMREADTSPIDLITRRYPGIVILKPYNACPQICVYCQRNWEIDQPMAPDAYPGREKISRACQWIKDHRHICEVLVTGGDPFVLPEAELKWLLGELAQIDHVDMIRLGTRTPVTLPMRITEDFARMLGQFRRCGKRDIAVVTHIEHPYEITPETAAAVDCLKRQGISVYNQFVYTFFVSRRFEAAALRLLLRRIGIDPYYTFVPKGKQETLPYQVPIARALQEQKEESRLIPGLRRTDEVVYNIPGLGKNYIKARQHRELLSLSPAGQRVYEFHPWEKNVVSYNTYITKDTPVLDYLQRLQQSGQNIEDYGSIWFYF